MDGSVAEGISTSLQTCPPDPQGQAACEDLTSFPPPPLHEDDLGLTPPPGSQQLQHTNTTRGSFKDEGTSTGDENPNHNAANLGNDSKNNRIDDLSPPDICSIGMNCPSDTIDGLFDGFDPEAAFRELQAALGPQKRAGEEAFPGELDFWNPPEKKRILELPHGSVGTSPEDTPSLSSPDSLLRPEQMESAPLTPTAVENNQSSNSLFDSLDALFEDPSFQIPLDWQENLESPTELPEPTTDMLSGGFDAVDDVSQVEQFDARPTITSFSEGTKERFGLDSTDIISNTVSETLRMHPKPQYTSPYPSCGGPLGYFPSAPGIHVRCVEAVDRNVCNRITGLEDRVQRLTYERNKYRASWNQWATIDPSTGKSKEQTLREENARLRRESSQLQTKVDEYKDEAAEWRARLNDLSIVYNNLLYEIHVQRKTPAVAPIPPGYKPPTSGGPSLLNVPLPSTVVPVQPAVPSGSSRDHPAVTTAQVPPQPLVSGPRPAPIMIDLTDEGDEPPAPPPSRPPGVGTIQSLRNKKYGWLQGPKRPETGTQAVSAPPSPSHHHTPDTPERSRSHPAFSAEEELVRAMEAELAQSN
ncbi:hypothetical protein BDV59DRAFT_139567 [Aspergillus ambiguus]|uniref:uncharacterized protein n=1 Tax=Aspergillus ambiguus TaxID=176160 RepID=UPI003CCCFE98